MSLYVIMTSFSILIARGLLWTTFSQNFFFWNITLICMLIVHNKGTFCASCQKWSFWPPKVENGRNLDLSHRILIKYTFLRSPDYKSYDHSKLKILISESIGRFFLTRFWSHVTRKSKKEAIRFFIFLSRLCRAKKWRKKIIQSHGRHFALF